HLFSLAHDVSDGGLDLALDEATAWSGLELVLTQHKLVEAPGVVVAVAPGTVVPWDDVIELGEVR
ncbi:MAG: hypothetical protein ACTHKS_04580, partial [Gaiellaceae bacterium]